MSDIYQVKGKKISEVASLDSFSGTENIPLQKGTNNYKVSTNDLAEYVESKINYVSKDQLNKPNGIPTLNDEGKLDTSVIPTGIETATEEALQQEIEDRKSEDSKLRREYQSADSSLQSQITDNKSEAKSYTDQKFNESKSYTDTAKTELDSKITKVSGDLSSFKNEVEQDAKDYVTKSVDGEQITGRKVFAKLPQSSAEVTNDIDLTNKKYVDSVAENVKDNIDANKVTTDTDQTISGLKTFTKLPESSAYPVDANDFVTKRYADGLAKGTFIFNESEISGETVSEEFLKYLTEAMSSEKLIGMRLTDNVQYVIKYENSDTDIRLIFSLADTANGKDSTITVRTTVIKKDIRSVVNTNCNVDIIKSGDGVQFLANDGTYKKVTKLMVGLDQVDNTADIDKPVSTAQQAAINTVNKNINDHKLNQNNPHNVTKAQVGLGNCDNTADADKPVSTPQKQYIQQQITDITAATDEKVEILRKNINAVDDKLTAEVTARTEADTTMQKQIDTVTSSLNDEIQKRSEETKKLTEDLHSEIDTRISEDVKLNKRVDDLDAKVDSNTEDLLNKLDKETAERKAADQQLQENLDAEAATREEKDTELNTKLDKEISDRTNADTEITNKLNQEIQDRTNADSTLQSNIDTEKKAREDADNALDTRLKAAETTLDELTDPDNPNSVDSKIDAAVDDLVNGASEGYQTLKDLETKIKEEVSRATGAESTLTDNLNSEISRAKEAESALQSNIDAEKERATSAENTLTTNLNAEIERAKKAESDLSTKLDSEISRSTTKDEELNTAIDAEKDRATAKENEINSALQAEITRATDKENEIDTALQNEVTRATNKENEINTDLTNFKNTKAQPSGLASLDENGKIVIAQLPEPVYSVVGVEKDLDTKAELLTDADAKASTENDFFYVREDKKIYMKTAHSGDGSTDTWTDGKTPHEHVIYNFRKLLDGRSNIVFRWDGQGMVEISSSLALGEVAGTAYPGDKGKDTTNKVNNILANNSIACLSSAQYIYEDTVTLLFNKSVHKYNSDGTLKSTTSEEKVKLPYATTDQPGIIKSDQHKLLEQLNKIGGVIDIKGLVKGSDYNRIDYSTIAVSYGSSSNTVGTNIRLTGATTEEAGLMTTADKVKLDTTIPNQIGDLNFTDAEYISKETNITDALLQLDEENKSTNDNLSALNQTVTNNKTAADNSISEINNKITEINNTIGGSGGESITSQISTINSNITRIDGNIDTIEGDVTTIKGDITNLKSKDTELQANIDKKYDKTGGTISGNVKITGNLEINGRTIRTYTQDGGNYYSEIFSSINVNEGGYALFVNGESVAELRARVGEFQSTVNIKAVAFVSTNSTYAGKATMSETVYGIKVLSQSEYDGLSSKNANILYIIKE